MSKPINRHSGVIVPMATPVTADGDLDESGVRRVMDFLVDGGVHGVFVLGTTGEGASIDAAMRSQLVKTAVNHADGRCLVYGGIGDNCVARSLEAAAEYHAHGVDAVVAHMPSYFPVGFEEIRRFFLDLADNLSGPLIVYNIPPTTHISIPVELIGELCAHPNIVGLKDSESNEKRLRTIIERFGDREDFAIQVGVAKHVLLGLELGADGFVPSSGNIDPDSCCGIFRHAKRGELEEARQAQEKMNAVGDFYQPGCALGETLSILKAAMSLKGLCEPHMLPPLQTKTDEEIAALRPGMEALGIL